MARRGACIRTPAGRRPVLDEMAQKLADHGYAVLVPDIYYRCGDWAPFDINTAFGDPEERKRLMSMMGRVTPEIMASDAAAFFDYLESRPEVSGTTFGTTGYCMGGRTSLVVAGRVPERVAAAMSFHGGGLASDDPGSPHLLADQMRPRCSSRRRERRLVHPRGGRDPRQGADRGGRRAHHRVLSRGTRFRGVRPRAPTTPAPPSDTGTRWRASSAPSSAEPGFA